MTNDTEDRAAAPAPEQQSALPDDLEFLKARVAYWHEALTETLQNAGVERLISFVVAILANQDAADRYTRLASVPAVPPSEPLTAWIVERWHAEVANRPLGNIHRRSLDDAWRQMLRHLGADDVTLLGPRHDDLLAASPSAAPVVAAPAQTGLRCNDGVRCPDAQQCEILGRCLRLNHAGALATEAPAGGSATPEPPAAAPGKP